MRTDARQNPFILDDANARLRRIAGVEDRIMGIHVWGLRSQHAPILPEDQKENRQNLVAFCLDSTNLLIELAHTKKHGLKDSKRRGRQTGLPNLTLSWPRLSIKMQL